MLDLSRLRENPSACINFSIGTGGAPSGGGWGSKGSAGNSSFCYYYPTGQHGASPIFIARSDGGSGGGNNVAGTGGYAYLDDYALSNGYC